jgi:hypothetical protein
MVHLLARIAFRGIYFPQVSKLQWFRAVWPNWRLMLRLASRLWSGADNSRPAPERARAIPRERPVEIPMGVAEEIPEEVPVGSLVGDRSGDSGD